MRVTITGADDKVDPLDLLGLSAEFPFVEFGILFSAKRLGTPRYPSSAWMAQLGRMMVPNMRLSLHLCGQAARDTVVGDSRWMGFIRPPVRRVQLNGYEPGSADDRLRVVANLSSVEFILQARDRAAMLACIEDAKAIRNASVLYDPSGGRGIGTQGWPDLPTSLVSVGFAGGIGPDNVETTLRAAWSLGAAWIDMESGVRNEDDDFDIERVRDVLERAKGLIA